MILIFRKIKQYISTAGDEGETTYVVMYEYEWEGATYKTGINAREHYFEALKNKEYLTVFIDPDTPDKTYHEPGMVIHSGIIVLQILAGVLFFCGAAFLLTAIIILSVIIVPLL
jgi:capsule polysaccharide export protein KpsE/RkpR